MAQSQPPHLWGQLKFPAVRPCSDLPGFVDLVIPGNVNPARVRGNDPGLKHLTPYRVGKKKVLVLFWQSPDKNNHVYAVFVTDSDRLVKQIFAIMQDDRPKKAERLLEKRPRYMA